MIAKPAMLECARCGKIFIGWETDVRPKGGPRCLKCRAREAWDVLASTVVPGTGRGAGAGARPRRAPKRAPARAKRGVARGSAGSRGAPKAAKRRRAKK